MARKRQIIYFDGTPVVLPMPLTTRTIKIGDYVEMDGAAYRVWYEEDHPKHRNLRAEFEMSAGEMFTPEAM